MYGAKKKKKLPRPIYAKTDFQNLVSNDILYVGYIRYIFIDVSKASLVIRFHSIWLHFKRLLPLFLAFPGRWNRTNVSVAVSIHARTYLNSFFRPASPVFCLRCSRCGCRWGDVFPLTLPDWISDDASAYKSPAVQARKIAFRFGHTFFLFYSHFSRNVILMSSRFKHFIVSFFTLTPLSFSLSKLEASSIPRFDASLE